MLIIAEAGVAHFGDTAKMDDLIDLAVEAGADVFKTQAFVTDEMIAPTLPDWRERMRSKEVGLDFLARVKAHCDTRGITFLCTAHDEHALAWLDDMDVDGFKIGSGEHGNIPFIIKVAERGKPVFLSTGMYDAADVVQTVNAVADIRFDV